MITGWRRLCAWGGPDRPSGGSFLNAVVALSASDAWAVGLSRSPGGPARTLVLHWDGWRWGITASPNAGPGDNFLVSVAAASARDAWAVGYRDARGVYRSLVEHWDGDRWTVVRLPRLGGPGNGLNAVDAAASGVVWAVGGSARARGPSQPLVLRLHGPNWSSVPAPASLHSATLNGVAGRCLGGRKLVRRPLVPADGRARHQRGVVERSNPWHPRLRQSSDGRGRVRRWRAVGGRERLTRRRHPACPDPSPLRQLALLTTGSSGRRLLAGHLGVVDEHPDRVGGQMDAHGRSLLPGRVSAAILHPRLQGLAMR